MGKFGSILKALIKTNYKDIRKKSQKKKIMSDVTNSVKNYQATSDDYERFAMYELNDEQKSTIITKGINEEIINKYNKPEYLDVFTDRKTFNKKFNRYLMRNWLFLSDTYQEFKEFTDKNPNITAISTENPKLVKKKYKINNKNRKKVYEELTSLKYDLLEEQLTQCKEFDSISNLDIVRIKAITLNDTIVAAYFYIKDEITLFAPINLETGIVDYSLVDKDGNIHERIPSTNESIMWFSIPKWPRIKRFILNLALVEPNVKYVEWDISLNKDPYVIKANIRPDHTIYQLPEHRIKGQGLLPIFQKAMEDKNENSNSNRS